MRKKILFLAVALILSLQSFAQLDITKRTVTLDSLKARQTSISVTDTTKFMKDLIVRDTTIIDLINNYIDKEISFGTDGQIAFTNSSGTDFDYDMNFEYDPLRARLNIGKYNSIYIGKESAKNFGTSSYNVIIGYRAAYIGIGAQANTIVGIESGYGGVSRDNVLIGWRAGYSGVGVENVIIGKEAGGNATGSGNIFIGIKSGYYEAGSNKLYIENSNSSTPLIYGEFDNDLIKINGTLEAKQTMHIAKAEVLKTDTVQTTIITLPANAVIWDVGIDVTTAFNDSGTDYLDIGTTSSADALINDYDVSTTSFINQLLSGSPYKITSSTNVTFIYTGQNDNATQGQAFIYIHYSLH
jgi:hypothetical protein